MQTLSTPNDDAIDAQIKKKRKLKILVIEDDARFSEEIVKTIKKILNEFLYSCEIDCSYSAEDALDKIVTQKKKYDLISIDINLGQSSRSGYALLLDISKFKSCNGLVVFTAIENDREYDKRRKTNTKEATPLDLSDRLKSLFPNYPNLTRRHLPPINKRFQPDIKASCDSLYEFLKEKCDPVSYCKLMRLEYRRSILEEDVKTDIDKLKATMNPIQPAILELAAPKSLFIPPFTLEVTNVDELLQDSLAIPRIKFWSSDGVSSFSIPDTLDGNRGAFFYFNLGVCKKHHKGIGEKHDILSYQDRDASLQYKFNGVSPSFERATKEIFYTKNAPEVALESSTIKHHLFYFKSNQGYYLIDSVILIGFENLTELRFPKQGK
ncbi:MAG: hypothetical protein WCO45_11295 [Pseudanabaena sp. ELA607]